MQAKVGEPVLAAGRFGCSRPATGGRRDWVSASMRVLALAMSRRDHDLPRHLILAVTTQRVVLLDAGATGVGRELASWARTHVRASAERSGREWRMWVQPPGDRPGFELRATAGPTADAVVTTLAARTY